MLISVISRINVLSQKPQIYDQRLLTNNFLKMESDIQQQRTDRIESSECVEHTPYSQLKSRVYYESPINLIDYSLGKRKAIDLDLNQNITRITELHEEDGITKDELQTETEIENTDMLFYDVFGNQIAPVLSEFQVFNSDEKETQEDRYEDPPIKEDKENEVPKFGLATPLKVRNMRAYPNRSPLLDITPSLTHRKPKKSSNTDHKNKTLFMTPKTMAESRNFDSSHLKHSRM